MLLRVTDFNDGMEVFNLSATIPTLQNMLWLGKFGSYVVVTGQIDHCAPLLQEKKYFRC